MASNRDMLLSLLTKSSKTGCLNVYQQLKNKSVNRLKPYTRLLTRFLQRSEIITLINREGGGRLVNDKNWNRIICF